MLETLLHINGQWKPAAGNEWFEVLSPLNNQVIGLAPLAENEDLEEAIQSADKTQASWGQTSVFDRSALLRQASEAVKKYGEHIAKIMTEEQGKPLSEARQEVTKGANILRYYAEEIERVGGRLISNDNSNCMSTVIYQPVGVSCAITPWNYPVELIAWKVGAALAAGCTLICKLPSHTPFSPSLFLKAILDSGLPPGVLQIVTGRGSDLGYKLVTDDRIKKIAFTGSTNVGKQIARQSASSLKRLTLELGGSLPLIVCRDGNLSAAVNGCLRRSFRNCGQICIAINRVYVDEAVYDEFLTLLTKRIQSLRIGNPKLEGIDIGPLCTRHGLERVIVHVEDAREKGGRIMTGGQRPVDFDLRAGNFYEPTLIADAHQSMLIMSEETFGPAIGASPFASLAEAIDLANDSPYGLAAIAYTNNIDNIRALTSQIEVGSLAINNVDVGTINAPYGGWKDSGLGVEHGTEGLYEYLLPKHLRFCLS